MGEQPQQAPQPQQPLVSDVVRAFLFFGGPLAQLGFRLNIGALIITYANFGGPTGQLGFRLFQVM